MFGASARANNPFSPLPIDNNTSYRMGNSNEWRYEMRREPQEIIERLWLGPFQASTKLDKMQALGITHVLCIRDRKETSIVFPRFPDKFVYMTLEISDNIDQNLISIFPQCRDLIENAWSNNGVILAHCNGGISLSPAIIIGYLMFKCGWSYEYALAFVQSKRYCVSPSSFTNQLSEYESIIHAQRTMAQRAVSDGDASLGYRNKRGLATDHDQDRESEEADYERKYQIPPNAFNAQYPPGGMDTT